MQKFLSSAGAPMVVMTVLLFFASHFYIAGLVRVFTQVTAPGMSPVGTPYYLPRGAPVTPRVFARTANKLLRWIITHSDYKLATLPPVLFVEKATMDYIVTFPGESHKTGVMGMYISGVGLMLLPKDFSFEEQDFILLHELVHHLQETHGTPFQCPGQAEAEAYRLHGKYVDEQRKLRNDPTYGWKRPEFSIIAMEMCANF
jgi:hypothetical protein